jgi:beta-galactosidase
MYFSRFEAASIISKTDNLIQSLFTDVGWGVVAGGAIQVERRTLTTAGAPSAIVLMPDRSNIDASRSDLSFVSATVVDSKGIAVVDAAVQVTFDVSGAGELAAVSSGDPTDPSSFQGATRTTYRGVAIAIVRPGSATAPPRTGGTITVKATAPGLKAASATVTY